jgi:hypothetical protein
VAQGKEAKLVAETLAISRSSLYYRRKPRASRADRSRDEEIITACGEKPAYGYRRVAWWLWRHHGLVVNGKRALRVLGERGLLVRQRRFQVSRIACQCHRGDRRIAIPERDRPSHRFAGLAGYSGRVGDCLTRSS